MAEFNIVHLSDLHIGADSLPLNLEKLIVSVKKETKGMKNIILCITGDIVDQGSYTKHPFTLKDKSSEYKDYRDNYEKLQQEIGRILPIYREFNKKEKNLYDKLCYKISPNKVYDSEIRDAIEKDVKEDKPLYCDKFYGEIFEDNISILGNRINELDNKLNKISKNVEDNKIEIKKELQERISLYKNINNQLTPYVKFIKHKLKQQIEYEKKNILSKIENQNRLNLKQDIQIFADKIFSFNNIIYNVKYCFSKSIIEESKQKEATKEKEKLFKQIVEICENIIKEFDNLNKDDIEYIYNEKLENIKKSFTEQIDKLIDSKEKTFIDIKETDSDNYLTYKSIIFCLFYGLFDLSKFHQQDEKIKVKEYRERLIKALNELKNRLTLKNKKREIKPYTEIKTEWAVDLLEEQLVKLLIQKIDLGATIKRNCGYYGFTLQGIEKNKIDIAVIKNYCYELLLESYMEIRWKLEKRTREKRILEASEGLNAFAIDFFKQLSEALLDPIESSDKKGLKTSRVIDIQIVPGNHDKDSSNKANIQYVQTLKNQTFVDYGQRFVGNKDDWDMQDIYFKDYKRFANLIFEIFNIPQHINIFENIDKQECGEYYEDGKFHCEGYEQDEDGFIKIKSINETFGVDFVAVPCRGILQDRRNCKIYCRDLPTERYENIENFRNCQRCKEYNGERHPDLTIAFIRLNTAMLSNTIKPENHKLSISKYQLDEVKKLYSANYLKRKNRSETILTFCLTHHPTQFLAPLDEDEFKFYLSDADSLNTDFHLCGHVHTRTISDITNNGRTVTTLVSGIGWKPDEKITNDLFVSPDKENQSYSIYNFNEEKNTLGIKIMKTNYAGEFISDYSYHNPQNPDGIALDFTIKPIRQVSVPYIDIAPNPNSLMSHKNLIVVDNSIMDFIQKMYFAKIEFMRLMSIFIRHISLHLFRTLLWCTKKSFIEQFTKDNTTKRVDEDLWKDLFSIYDSEEEGIKNIKESRKIVISKILDEKLHNDISSMLSSKVDSNITENSRGLLVLCEEYISLKKEMKRLEKENRSTVKEEVALNEIYEKIEKCKILRTKLEDNDEYNNALENIKNTKDFDYNYYIWTYINHIGRSLFDVFKKIFIDDDLRIVIRAYNENEETKEITYVPIWDNSNELNIDKNIREYKYQKIDELKKTDNKKYITALAYEEKEIKYYSLNRESIDFSVKSWEDFAVIVPKVNHWSIPDESSHDGEYPLISIVFSVKLSQVAIKTKTYAEKKILYKELCNKLYLLQYIELRKGIQDALHKFNSIFDFQYLDRQAKIDMIKYCEKEYNKEIAEEEKNN